MPDFFRLLQQMFTYLAGDPQERLADALFFGAEGFFQGVISEWIGRLEKRVSKYGLKIGAEDFSPFGSIGYWDKIFKTIKNTNQELGIAGNLGMGIENAFKGALDAAANIGASWEDVAGEYKAFTEQLGRNRAFSSDELVKLTEIKKAFGEGATEIFSTFNMIGISIEDTSKELGRVALRANKIGVNTSQVIKTLKKNIGALNKYSFREGTRGLEKMAELAVQTKISMQSTFALTEEIWKGGIEGAIEMGADLQVLGGEFAALGDPFELFYMARNAPEELQERIAGLTGTMASFNRETGEIVIDPHSFSQIRQFAEISKTSVEDLAASAKLARKEMEIESLFDMDIRAKGDFDDILTKVAGIAEFDKGMNDWVVKFNKDGREITKSISDITKGDIGSLDVMATTDEEDVFKKLIVSNESLIETMNKLIEIYKLNVLGEADYQKLSGRIVPQSEAMREKFMSGDVGQFGELIKKLSAGSTDNPIKAIDTGGDISGLFSVAMDNLSDTFNQSWDIVGTGVNAAIDMFLDNIGNVFSWIGNKLWDSAASYFEESGGIFGGLWNITKESYKKVFDPFGLGGKIYEWLQGSDKGGNASGGVNPNATGISFKTGPDLTPSTSNVNVSPSRLFNETTGLTDPKAKLTSNISPSAGVVEHRGMITLSLGDKKAEFTPQQIEQIFRMLESTANGDKMSGGKGTGNSEVSRITPSSKKL